MRTPIAALLLAGCAVAPPQPSQADIEAYHARLVATYGPRCAQTYKEWSSGWQSCVDGFANQERQELALRRAAAAAAIMSANPPPKLAPITPIYPSPQNPALNCTTVNYGGIVQTRCQ